MGYSHGRLGTRLTRLETHLTTHAAGRCPVCQGGHLLEMIYTGQSPRGCKHCGQVGAHLVIIEPTLGPDGMPDPVEADMMV